MALPVISGSDGTWGTTINNFLGGAAGDGTPTIPTNRVPYMSGTNLTSSANLTFDGTTLTVNALVVTAGGFRASAAGLVFINESSNTNMTIGLTINQGANSNHILALKSSSVAHGVTSEAETDTYAFLGRSSTGGLQLTALESQTLGYSLRLHGISPTSNTTKTTSGRAKVELHGHGVSGINTVAAGLDANLVSITNDGTTRFLFDAEGSSHADVEWTTFDNYDDLALLDAVQVEITNRLTPAKYGHNSLYYNKEYLEKLGIIGKDSWHFETLDGRNQFRSMVNFSRLAMLHHGAILQVGNKLQQYEERVKRLEKKYGNGCSKRGNTSRISD
mgnify:FL=1